MIVKLQGGLGNQMFIYAFGRSEGLRRNEPVFFDKSTLLPEAEPFRDYQLGVYGLPIQFATPGLEGEVFHGYFQSEKYFDAPLIRSEFRRPRTRPNPQCMNMADKMFNNAFMCIRRGDYLWPNRINFHGVMSHEWYKEAASMLPSWVKIYIFTDDIPWARLNFPQYPVVDVNGTDEKAWDIWLMSMCTHAITSNSTFGWWGAWLGPDKLGKVIAPKKWFLETPPADCTEIVPERWTTL